MVDHFSPKTVISWFGILFKYLNRIEIDKVSEIFPTF